MFLDTRVFPRFRGEHLMVNSDLRQQLAALHAELARTSSVDPQSRELLASILGDITRLLGPAGTSTGVVADEPDLTEKLDGAAVQFEAEHPALGAAIRRLVDALGKAGI
jgi:hypothetical protein